MIPLENIIAAAQARPRHIVMSEGEDPRVVEGALRASREGLARISLVGETDKVRAQLAGQGAAPDELTVDDPAASPLADDLAAALHALREHKGMDEAAARLAIREPLAYSAMLVREGHADGTIGGAVATTADTVRTALQIIGRAPDCPMVSSFFLMMLCEHHHTRKGAMVFADCGMVVDPDVDELATIAVSATRSYESLVAETPKVAMLSFSTGGSASHDRVAKVVEATKRVKAREPSLIIQGDIQFDAAFVPAVSVAKAPDSVLDGEANVFIFPNLDAANIGYKIAQRIGNAKAIGPILQGLAKPANDLSRGCTAEDVYHIIAVTGVQANGGVRESVQPASG